MNGSLRVKTKTYPNFAVRLAESSNHPFLQSTLMNHIFQTSVLFQIRDIRMCSV